MIHRLCKITMTLVISLLGGFSSLSVQAEVTLRDAIYLYNQDIFAGGLTEIIGENCDIFQLVLDVDSGYTDIAMGQKADPASPWINNRYPDRIYNDAAMFAYMQYGTSLYKSFMFDDKNLPTSATNKIGKATVFGYCLSSNPSAYVYLYDEAACVIKYSNGETSQITNCTPVLQIPSGGSSEPPVQAPTTPPVANAGRAQGVVIGATVTLDASTSSAAVGKTMTYAWTLINKPAGSAATLAAPTTAKPTFVADVAGLFVASVIVNDGTRDSSAASVSITASVANAVPVANAGVAQNVVAGSVVTLDGSASSDANGDSLTYAWTLTSKPAGSSAALSSASSARPTFMADLAGTYVASLTVNDGKVSSTLSTVSITAAVLNFAPVANAGTAQNVVAGTIVTLDGSASSDANGDSLTYLWTLTSVPTGCNCTLFDSTTAKPSLATDIAGTYVVSLVVNDGQVNSTVKTVAITALAQVPPPDSGSPYAWDDPAIVNALREGNYTWDGSVTLLSVNIAENGSVVPVEVRASREFKSGERLYIVVNDSFIGASLTPLDSRAQLFLSTRVKMPATGQLKAVLVDSSGRMSIASQVVNVTYGADLNISEDSPSIGPIRLRSTSNAGSLDMISLMNSSQNQELYIKTVGYYVDGTKIADVGLTPGSAKNPYVAIKVSGSGSQTEMQAIASNGESLRDSRMVE